LSLLAGVAALHTQDLLMSAEILGTILFLDLSHQLLVVVVKHGMWEAQTLMVVLAVVAEQTQLLVALVLLGKVTLAAQV
jgi:hypothetical protein